MERMGLVGANNPIFQASQQMAQQSGQQKALAVQGIINQNIETKKTEVAAKLKTASVLMESKDPFQQKKGYEIMSGIMGGDPQAEITQHLDDIRSTFSNLNKMEGKIDPYTFNEIVKDSMQRFGQVPEGMQKRAQESAETNMLGQASQIQGLQTQGLLTSEQATQGRMTALEHAGTKGQEILAKGMEAEKDTAASSLREFETVNGISSDKRGTPEYKKAYEDWLKIKNPGAGSGQIVIMPTAEGFAAINKKTGTATPVTGAGGEAINKPLTGEMITTQQQIGTLKGTFDRVRELYKPEFVGPIEGRTGGLRSATIGNPKDRATFYSALQDINNSLVYLKSGKQINEQEYERLKGAMPHKNLADSDFKARMTEFDRVLNSITTERQKNMGGYGAGQTKTPTISEWMNAATKANPAATKSELIKYYNNKYKKGK